MDTNSLCDVLRKQYYIFYKQKAIYDNWNENWMKLYSAKKNLKSKMPLVVLIFVIVSGLSILPIIIFGLYAAYIAYNSKGKYEISKTDIAIVLIISFIITIVLCVIIPLVVYLLRQRSIKRKINQYMTEINQAKRQIESYYNSVKEPLIPINYTSPYVLWEIYEIARAGRAHSINEAIYQYEYDIQENYALLRKQKAVKANKLKNIALTCATVYFLSRPDQIDIYVK